MIKQFFIIFSALIMLVNCEVISVYQNEVANSKESQSAPELTRAQVEKSGLAMIRIFKSSSDKRGQALMAQALNNQTVSYGINSRTQILLRGGLIYGTYGLGTDLIGVITQPQDPIVKQTPTAQWPQSYQRSYQWITDGVVPKNQIVNCQNRKIGKGTVTIVEKTYNTELIAETCQGDGLKFENRYMVDSHGFIWKSEQFIGGQVTQITLEILEPLD